MKVNSDHTGRWTMNCVRLLGLVLTLMIFAPGAGAQTQATEQKPAETKQPDAGIYQTLYPANVTHYNDANDILTDLRNMLPKARIYYVGSSDAISIHATPEDIQTARKILSEIDRPKKAYRLTYTITETDSGKQIGTQHYSLVVFSGRPTILKQGSRVPVAAGIKDNEASTQNAQEQYVDVGLNISAHLEGVRLYSIISQSSIVEEKPGVGVQNPVIRETRLDGMSPLMPGKTFALGSIDIPGTTRRLEIEVSAELVQ